MSRRPAIPKLSAGLRDPPYIGPSRFLGAVAFPPWRGFCRRHLSFLATQFREVRNIAGALTRSIGTLVGNRYIASLVYEARNYIAMVTATPEYRRLPWRTRR